MFVIPGPDNTGEVPIDEAYSHLEMAFNCPFLVFLVDNQNRVPLLVGRVKNPKFEQKKCVIL